MSTFDGVVPEFPNIRIDYFRPSPAETQPALAYFLSHVHSDHLVGLETCKSPFIYCSPATRDILLRLEKYPHRMNFAKGILETRRQTYRHLKNLLKAIPLETPTTIELSPGQNIRVTCFDANHCVGAVVFLIEGNGRAVLYTGDIRSETWWVDAFIRQPTLLRYTCASGMEPSVRLDTIYLDTTFVVTGKDELYAQFPSKADGLSELLRKIAQYPKDTLFYLDAWTFGYEDVWQALSRFFGSSIHVDDYRYGLYRALANGIEPKAAEAAKLIGFHCGNHFQRGCLSTRSEECRIHSCEKGTGCEIWSKGFVRITPIVSRHNGVEIAELGAGGGKGDLNQQHELDISDATLVNQLMALCASKLHTQPHLLSSVLSMLASKANDRVQSIKLDEFVQSCHIDQASAAGEQKDADQLEDLPLEKLVSTLAKMITMKNQDKALETNSSKSKSAAASANRADGLPTRITFPYSRHSSYNELCQLIEAFRPNNIHPCTVDESSWTPSCSMSFLFGHIYHTLPSFRHDQGMLKKSQTASEEGKHSLGQASSQNSTDDYATPNTYAPIAKTNLAQTATPNDLALAAGAIHEEHVERKPTVASAKRKRDKLHSHVDLARSVNVNHYSPTRAMREREPSATMTTNRFNDRSANRWPGLTSGKSQPADLLDDFESKRNAEPLQSVDQFEVEQSVKAIVHARQPPEHGRSPLPTHMNPSPASSPAQQRLSFRQEVHDSLMRKAGSTWSNIGLVSINGHQTKEEEL